MAAPTVVLDGGMISEVARRIDLPFSTKGWSLRPLLDAQGRQAITQLHKEYLAAGAELVETASYNVSAEALEALGFTSTSTRDLMMAAVECAEAAGAKPEQIIYAMGPMGAAAFAGREYTDDGQGRHEAMVTFHRRRIREIVEVLCDDSGKTTTGSSSSSSSSSSSHFSPCGRIAALAFETTPSLAEGRAIVEALAAEARRIEEARQRGAAASGKGKRSPPQPSPLPPAWITFTLSSRAALTDASWSEAVAFMESLTLSSSSSSSSSSSPSLVSHYGVNCSHPAVTARAIRYAANHQRTSTSTSTSGDDRKVLVAYPNDGKYWRGDSYTWSGEAAIPGRAAGGLYASMVEAGATVVGGCCNCSPSHVEHWRKWEQQQMQAVARSNKRQQKEAVSAKKRQKQG